MGEIYYIGEYLERKAAEQRKDNVPKRLAEIALDIALLESERQHLKELYPPETE